MAENNKTPKSGDAAQMQENNATGANLNEQGQASFTTGSTVGAGSDYGQGSSQLGGESYRQGSTTSEGANYNNETGRLSDSSIGTSNEGSSSRKAGAGQSGRDQQQVSGTTARDSDTNLSSQEDRGQEQNNKVPHEGDRRDTSLEEDSHLDTDNTTASRRYQSGSWSSSSAEPGRE
jgi:hypothetical protein